jgi:hypothetical protein
MSSNQDNFKLELYNFLKSQGYNPKMLSTSGKSVPVSDEAEVFQFEFIKDNVNYGNIYCSLDNSNAFIIYTTDEATNSPSESIHNDEYSWDQLINALRAMTYNKGIKPFEVKNKDHLEHDMAKREHNKKLDEGYYSMGKKTSYSDNIPKTKMIIQHTRNIEEGEQRYRNIAKIFVENINGERFLLPTNKPGLARVYARHVAEGGTPYDERGVHITSLCEEYQKMAGFVRATRNGQFNESAQKLVTEAINHYEKLRESLRKMASGRGYNSYFESYTPALMEDEGSIDLSNMFMSSSLDPRIESVLPILSKLSKNISETSDIKQVTELSEWADKLTEFANTDAGNGGDDYLRTLASAWYNQDLSAIAHEVKKDKNPKKKSMMDRVIDAQVAVEKMLARGVICGDDKVRKFSIDYNSDFDGVIMTYEDYAEYSDYGDDGEDIDSRTGKPWPNSKYDQIEFTDDQLDEGKQMQSVAKTTGDPKFDKMLKGITGKKAVAKQQKADTKQQTRDAFGSMFGGGNPADKLKIKEQGMAEGSHDDDEDDGLIAGRYTPQQWAKMVAIVRKKAQEQDAKKKIAVVKTNKPIGTRVSDIDPWSGKESNVKTDSEWDKQKGVAEGFPQPGESSGKAKQFNPNAKVQTREMTLDQILNSVKGIPYVNNVVDDWDAKDYSWGVTKKVIEYAQYLQKNPQSVANLPPLVVIDGQLNDGAHRLSAINLLQKRMDPKNPLWKQVKLKVKFGTSADVASEQGVAEDTYNDDVKRAFPSGKAPGVKTGANAPKGTSTMPKDEEKAKGNPVAEGSELIRILKLSGLE